MNFEDIDKQVSELDSASLQKILKVVKNEIAQRDKAIEKELESKIYELFYEVKNKGFSLQAWDHYNECWLDVEAVTCLAITKRTI